MTTPRPLSVLKRVIDQKLRGQVNIHEYQFGFMPGRSTVDAIFIMRQVQAKFLEGNRKYCFADLEKAYDRPGEEGRPGTSHTTHQDDGQCVMDTLTLEFREEEPQDLWELLFADDSYSGGNRRGVAKKIHSLEGENGTKWITDLGLEKEGGEFAGEDRDANGSMDSGKRKEERVPTSAGERGESADIRRMAEICSIREKAREARLRYFGHVKRGAEEDPVRRAVEMEVRGRRSVGRQRKRWKDTAKEDMRALGTVELVIEDYREGKLERLTL
nr:uncharacterized protein LOC113824650 [Penaeus vannamei]